MGSIIFKVFPILFNGLAIEKLYLGGGQFGFWVGENNIEGNNISAPSLVIKIMASSNVKGPRVREVINMKRRVMDVYSNIDMTND